MNRKVLSEGPIEKILQLDYTQKEGEGIYRRHFTQALVTM